MSAIYAGTRANSCATSPTATVRLPAAWLAPGDATILALDEPRPAGRRPEHPVQGTARPVRTPGRPDRVADQHVHRAAEGHRNAVHEERPGVAAPWSRTRPSPRPAVRAVRRLGPGPSRPNWPRTSQRCCGRCLRDRRSRQAAADRDPRDLKALIQPLMPEVRRLVLEWTALKRLRPDEADYVVSEVLDQLIRTVAERNEPPREPGRLESLHRAVEVADRLHRPGSMWPLARACGASGTDDVHDEVSRRVDLERRLQAHLGSAGQARHVVRHADPAAPGRRPHLSRGRLPGRHLAMSS